MTRLALRSTAVTAALTVLLAGLVAPAAVGDTSKARQTTTATAQDALKSLPVKGRAAKTGYSRSKFGSAWKDVDGNKCDTRNDILRRDLVERGMQGSCTVLTGVLYPDPYTGMSIVFTRGKSTIDIDHVVALGNAWVTGAFRWNTAKRTAIANDPLNLLAVDYSANRQKGDADAATWLPSNKGYRCAYVARQIAVKAKYGLWVTRAERNAMSKVLSACPDQPLPTDGSAPEPAPTVAPAPARPSSSPTPTASPSGEITRYRTCADARAAGVAPILKSVSPQLYAANTHLDRDKDGRACT